MYIRLIRKEPNTKCSVVLLHTAFGKIFIVMQSWLVSSRLVTNSAYVFMGLKDLLLVMFYLNT